MALIIAEKKYNAIKSGLKEGLTQAQVAQREFCAQSTVSKVKNTKNYKEYRNLLTKKAEPEIPELKYEPMKKEGFLTKLAGWFK